MKSHIPGLIVYKHNKTGIFCIQRLTLDKDGFTTWVGDLVRLSPDQMLQEGLYVVLQYLSEFGRLDASQGSEIMRLPAKERRRFIATHSSVGIDLIEPSVLSFSPMQKTHGGAVGKADDRFTLQLPTSADRFYEALLLAFDRAGESVRSLDDL